MRKSVKKKRSPAKRETLSHAKLAKKLTLKPIESKLEKPLVWPNIPQARQTVQVMAMQVGFAQTEWWKPEQLEREQLKQVQSLINHAVNTVPFYKTRFTDILSENSDTFTIEDFRKLPLLSRAEAQTAGSQLFSNSVPASHGKLANVSTSGSTGQPLKIKTTGLSGLFFMAHSLRFHMWFKRDFRQGRMIVSSFSSKTKVQKINGWMGEYPSGPLYKVNFTLPAPQILELILKYEPGYLEIHPSTLTELLRLSRKSGRVPKNLLDITSVSEALSDDLRQECQKLWGVPIVNLYSAQELNTLAVQCPDHPENLHVQSESVILEVLDKNGKPCKPGEMGRCVVTQLINHASPLIRYEYGDYAIVGDPCPCGRGLPTIRQITGRERNLLILENGDRLSPRLALEDLVGKLPVLQYQLVQKTFKDIEIRLATSKRLTAEQEALIIDQCDRDIGQPLHYFITYHDTIPKLASGKFEAFRCEVGPDDSYSYTFSRMADISPEDWDRCSDPDYPTISHAYLSSLEDSGCVSSERGIFPNHIIVRHKETDMIRAVVPLYLKQNSMGELGLDYTWDKYYDGTAANYYPKLQSEVPFTPVITPKILIDPAYQDQLKPVEIIRKIHQLSLEKNISSFHMSYVDKNQTADIDLPGAIHQIHLQFHWHNRDYKSFDEYLSHLKSDARSAIKRERRMVEKHSLEFVTIEGTDLTTEQMDFAFKLYLETNKKYKEPAYLNRKFFNLVLNRMPENIVVFMAMEKNIPIAAILTFKSNNRMFIRYWGATKDIKFLHFELTYYRVMEYAIDNGIKYIDGGAAGFHKKERGMEPVDIHHAHIINDHNFLKTAQKRLTAMANHWMQLHQKHKALRLYKTQPSDTLNGSQEEQ